MGRQKMNGTYLRITSDRSEGKKKIGKGRREGGGLVWGCEKIQTNLVKKKKKQRKNTTDCKRKTHAERPRYKHQAQNKRKLKGEIGLKMRKMNKMEMFRYWV